MTKPVYEDHKFEALKTRYVEHASHMRDLNQFELRVFGGFLTIQLVLAGWFGSHPLENTLAKVGVFVVDLALLIVCLQILRAVRVRRGEVRETILNINEALGFYEPGVYLSDKAINPPPTPPAFHWFYVGCCVGFVGAVLALFSR